jgi:hypothetical protein
MITQEAIDQAERFGTREELRMLVDVDFAVEASGVPAEVLSSSSGPGYAQLRLGVVRLSGKPVRWFGVIYRVTLGYDGSFLFAEIGGASMIGDGRTVSGYLSLPQIRISTDLEGRVADELSLDGVVQREAAPALAFQTALGFQLLQRLS